MSAESHASANILVVDDTLENLRVLSGMLATRGFDVRPVATGREALLAVEHDRPDLVLLDVMMPDMNGFDVCTRLKAKPEWREIPVIFLTALTDVGSKVQGFAAGGTDYVTKPFQIEEVLARVESQLALLRARRELSDCLQNLRELERLRDDLVHMVVHDMRSPLMVLMMRLDRIKARVNGDLEPVVGQAVRTALDLNRMADTLLDVSRLETGKMPLEKAPCDLSHLASEVREAMAPADARTIEVDAASPAIAPCDEKLVRRVLENLVGNGLRHTPTAGRLRLAVRPGTGRVRVTVEDEGPGVPLEARERIFQKFGTVASRKDQSYHSVGLGLAFCKLAVESHGGRIGVDSVSPSGSSFWFELPDGH